MLTIGDLQHVVTDWTFISGLGQFPTIKALSTSRVVDSRISNAITGITYWLDDHLLVREVNHITTSGWLCLGKDKYSVRYKTDFPPVAIIYQLITSMCRISMFFHVQMQMYCFLHNASEARNRNSSFLVSFFDFVGKKKLMGYSINMRRSFKVTGCLTKLYILIFSAMFLVFLQLTLWHCTCFPIMPTVSTVQPSLDDAMKTASRLNGPSCQQLLSPLDNKCQYLYVVNESDLGATMRIWVCYVAECILMYACIYAHGFISRFDSLSVQLISLRCWYHYSRLCLPMTQWYGALWHPQRTLT